MNLASIFPYVAVAVVFAATALISKKTPLKVKLAKVAGDLCGAAMGYYLYSFVEVGYNPGLLVLVGISGVVSVLFYGDCSDDRLKQLWGFVFHFLVTNAAFLVLARFGLM